MYNLLKVIFHASEMTRERERDIIRFIIINYFTFGLKMGNEHTHICSNKRASKMAMTKESDSLLKRFHLADH